MEETLEIRGDEELLAALRESEKDVKASEVAWEGEARTRPCLISS